MMIINWLTRISMIVGSKTRQCLNATIPQAGLFNCVHLGDINQINEGDVLVSLPWEKFA